MLFLGKHEIARRGLSDGVQRVVRNFRVVDYEFAEGSCAAYYPEINALIPLGSHDPLSGTPAYKGIPVRITGATAG